MIKFLVYYVVVLGSVARCRDSHRNETAVAIIVVDFDVEVLGFVAVVLETPMA